MKVTFVYPSFERHADSHPELLDCVPCDEYLGSPSLGLACLSAVTPDDVETKFIDDRVSRFDPDREEADLFALSFFTPAASRAMEIGRELVARGKKVVMGGIFPTVMPEALRDCCTSVVVGEGEPVWGQVLADARRGELRPLYRFEGVYDLRGAGVPDVGLYIDTENERYQPDDYPLQLCRGCPVRCVACAIPPVMGTRFRFFDPETSIQAALDLYRRGKRMCITEDTLFLPKNRTIFRKFLLDLHERTGREPVRVSYIGISMPMILNLDDELLRLLVNIGVNRFYLVCGFDPITQRGFGLGEPAALEDCRRAILRSQEFGILPYVSLLVGGDCDDESVFDRLLEFTSATRVETAEFAISTPYPGTPAWARLNEEGRILSREWRKYNDANVVFRPRNMTPDRLQEGYLTLWKEFYRTRQHLRTAGRELATIQF